LRFSRLKSSCFTTSPWKYRYCRTYLETASALNWWCLDQRRLQLGKGVDWFRWANSGLFPLSELCSSRHFQFDLNIIFCWIEEYTKESCNELRSLQFDKMSWSSTNSSLEMSNLNGQCNTERLTLYWFEALSAI